MLVPTSVSAGGGDYRVNPNADMQLSLLYDPASHRPSIPYFEIFDRLFSSTSVASLDSGFDSIDENFANKVNLNRKFRWGVCQSIMKSSLEFIEAMANDSKLKDADYSRLLEQRVELVSSCQSVSDLDGLKARTTPYDAYLLGAFYFYNADFAKSIVFFTQAQKHAKRWFKKRDSWLLEATAYSLARALSLQAQDDINTDVVRSELLNESIEQFDQYLEQYPAGRYAQSALGLKRRAYYLLGDMPSYQSEFKAAQFNRFRGMVRAPSVSKNMVSAFKADFLEYSRFYSDDSTDLLKAFSVILREEQGGANQASIIAEREINLLIDLVDEYKAGALKDRDLSEFEDNALFELYLSIYARDWQRHEKHQHLIDNIEKYSKYFNYSSDPDLLLANSIRKQNGARALYNYPSFNNGFVKRNFMQDLCDVSVGEQALFDPSYNLASEKDQFYLARLFIDYYIRLGDFSKLEELYSLYPDTALDDYSRIRTAVNSVAKGNKNAGKGYMNIGYFLSTRNRSYGLSRGERPSLSEKCAQSNLKAVKPMVGYDYLETAERLLQQGDDHAKTMHFLVLCSSYNLDCNSYKDSDYRGEWSESNRKPSKYWFDRLHKEYRNSKWTKKTPYYYND